TTSVEHNSKGAMVVCEEFLYKAPPSVTDKFVIIGTSQFNVNARDAFNEVYSNVQSGDKVTIIVKENVVVGSSSIFDYALDAGHWPSGVTLKLEIQAGAYVAGAGGAGGAGGTLTQNGEDGQPGGPAIRARYPISIDNQGHIWGGVGGGGGGGSNRRNYDVPMCDS